MDNIYADVSVIIPTYNSSQTLDRALKSVLCQTLPVREIIIIDDASRAEERLFTESIISKCPAPSPKISFYQNFTNLGPSAARNKGVVQAAGKYVAFLDSDDIWHPLKIEIQYRLMEDANMRLSGHGFQHIVIGNIKALLDGFEYRVINRLELLIRNPFATPTIMALRKDFLLFPEDIRYSEDYWCWIRNFKSGQIYFINSVLAGGYKSSYGASGLSQDIEKMSKGVSKTFWSLYKSGVINKFELYLALAIENAKYLVRVLVLKQRGTRTRIK